MSNACNCPMCAVRRVLKAERARCRALIGQHKSAMETLSIDSKDSGRDAVETVYKAGVLDGVVDTLRTESDVLTTAINVLEGRSTR